MGTLISILMPAFNAGYYLEESVRSILDQTHRDLELILVDDGSTDGSVETVADKVRDLRLKIYRTANRGKPAAMNFAMERATGEYYAMQDADDISHPRRIEKQIRCLVENPDIAACFCGYDLIIGRRHFAPLVNQKDREQCADDIKVFKMPSMDPTGMFRISLVASHRYDENLRGVEGFDYILRIGEKFPMMVVGQCLYSYRIHASSTTRRNIDVRNEGVAKVLEAAARRRGLTLSAVRREHPVRLSSDRNRDLDNNLAALFMNSARELVSLGKRWAALKVGFQCVSLHPLDPYYYKAFLYACLPSNISARRR
jgi:glycosyltransferase involved in cell wall biosynthesis